MRTVMGAADRPLVFTGQQVALNTQESRAANAAAIGISVDAQNFIARMKTNMLVMASCVCCPPSSLLAAMYIACVCDWSLLVGKRLQPWKGLSTVVACSITQPLCVPQVVLVRERMPPGCHFSRACPL